MPTNLTAADVARLQAGGAVLGPASVIPGMTDQEKIEAFDAIAKAMTNQWSDGLWSWWNPTPSCGTETKRATREEALQDLVEWAKRTAKKRS